MIDYYEQSLFFFTEIEELKARMNSYKHLRHASSKIPYIFNIRQLIHNVINRNLTLTKYFKSEHVSLILCCINIQVSPRRLTFKLLAWHTFSNNYTTRTNFELRINEINFIILACYFFFLSNFLEIRGSVSRITGSLAGTTLFLWG